MAYKIKYMTKRGGGMVVILPSIEMVKDKLMRLFKSRTAAKAEKDNTTIGECYKSDDRWNWYIDMDA